MILGTPMKMVLMDATDAETYLDRRGVVILWAGKPQPDWEPYVTASGKTWFSLPTNPAILWVIEQLDALGVEPRMTLEIEISEGVAWIHQIVGKGRLTLFDVYDGEGNRVDRSLVTWRRRFDLRGGSGSAAPSRRPTGPDADA